MAGNYPDVPGHRMAYDLDGTQVYEVSNSANVTQVSAANLANGNAETGTNLYGFTTNSNRRFAMIFPEKRDVVGVYVQGSFNASTGQSSLYPFESSVDTTNGIDGTWVQVLPGATSALGYLVVGAAGAYRNNITAVSCPGVKALRFGATTSGSAEAHYLDIFHVYGSLTAGENPDRLELWHPTLDQRVGAAYFDWGDARRGTSATRTFRVKNLSSTLTANNIVVSLSALTDTTPSNLSQHSLSADGITFGSTASAGTLAPGGISQVLTIKRDTNGSAVLSLWALRIKAAAASWS